MWVICRPGTWRAGQHAGRRARAEPHEPGTPDSTGSAGVSRSSAGSGKEEGSEGAPCTPHLRHCSNATAEECVDVTAPGRCGERTAFV